MKQTYYIVQTWSDLFVQKTDELGYVQCYGRGKALGCYHFKN